MDSSRRLISESYQALLQITHANSPGWGSTAHKTARFLKTFAEPTPTTRLLDYGCGKATLTWPGPVSRYDPGIPEFSVCPPGPFDVVACVDVLEHVEPDCLDVVLDDLFTKAPRVFLVIDTVPAKKILPDGRNAHLSVHSQEWWDKKLRSYPWVDCMGHDDGRRLTRFYARA